MPVAHSTFPYLSVDLAARVAALNPLSGQQFRPHPPPPQTSASAYLPTAHVTFPPIPPSIVSGSALGTASVGSGSVFSAIVPPPPPPFQGLTPAQLRAAYAALLPLPQNNSRQFNVSFFYNKLYIYI